MKALFVSLLTRKNERDIFPVGYGYIMGYVEKFGHECDVLLPRAYFMTEGDVEACLRKSDAQIVGFGGMFNDLLRAVELSELVRRVRPDMKILIGGPMTTYSANLAMRKTGADYGICGDGEIATLKLLDALEKREDPTGIPGLVTWQGDRVVANGYADQIEMDDVVFPDWSKFPMEYFMHLHQGASLGEIFSGDYRGTFSWVFSRGCIGRCNFCSPGGRPRFMSVKKMVDFIEDICRRFDLKGFGFADNIIAPSKKYLLEMCEEFIRRGLDNIRFSGNLRANQVDSEVAAALKSAGFGSMGMGIESASNDLLRKMRKNVTVEEIDAAITTFKDADIQVLLSCMFGQPGETLEDCVNTLSMFMKSSDILHPSYNMHFFSPLYTYPGAPIYDWALKNGYYENEDAFYDEFFVEGKQGYMNYTKYSDELQWEFVHIGRMLNEWQNHKNQKVHLERSLLCKYSEIEAMNNLQRVIVAGPLAKDEVSDALDGCDLKDRRIVLYGIADVAEMVANYFAGHKLDFVAACDGYKTKWGMDFHGRKVCSISDVSINSYDTVLLCTQSISSEEMILRRLKEAGIMATKSAIRLFSLIQKLKHQRQSVRVAASKSNEKEALTALRRILRDFI